MKREELLDYYEKANKIEGFRALSSKEIVDDIFNYFISQGTLHNNSEKGIVEVGCFRGGLSVLFAYLSKSLDYPYYIIDINKEHLEFTSDLLSRIGFKNNIHYFSGDFMQFSTSVSLNFPPRFVFIDGDHRYSGVVSDIKALNKLNFKPHAVGFHDFSLRYVGESDLRDTFVDKAVNEFFEKNEIIRIGYQFNENPTPSKQCPGEGGFYWEPMGSEAVIVKL